MENSLFMLSVLYFYTWIIAVNVEKKTSRARASEFPFYEENFLRDALRVLAETWQATLVPLALSRPVH